jgi:hypothetical protein
MAAFVVPAVDGEINLFRLIDCMIKPAIDIDDAANTTLSVRGIRLYHNVFKAFLSPLIRSINDMGITPMKSDAMNKTKNKTNKMNFRLTTYL